MTSLINPNNIDITYPIAGQDNDTQGFRTNFQNIQNNFVTAGNEITGLQSNVTNLQLYGGASFSTLTANGSSQLTAANVTTQTTAVISAAVGTGIMLPVPYYAGQVAYIDAGSGSPNGVNVYPSPGGQIDANPINYPITLSLSSYWIGVCEQVNPPVWASFVGQFTGNTNQIVTAYINGAVSFGLSNTVVFPGTAQLVSLTQTQVAALTPVAGMMVYNSTYGNIQAYTAHLGRWGNVVVS
jgi:hypothetical protein